MRSLSAFVLALALLSALAPSRAHAAAAFSLSAGPTGTSAFGFEGGWGISGAFTQPIAPVASFIARADYHHLPDEPTSFYAIPFSPAEIGNGGNVESATVYGAFGGLRLHGPEGRPVQTHIDALVGIGHVRDGSPVDWRSGASGRLEVRDDTNLALSFGGGVRTLMAGADVFLEGRYDFYFANGDGVALIPIRVGLTLP